MQIRLKLLLIISLIMFSTVTTATGQWSDEIKLSEGANPTIDIEQSTGNAYVLSMYNGVTLTKIDMNGNVLGQETVINASNDRGGTRWGADMAVGPNGEPHVIYRRYENNNNYSAFYTYKMGSAWSSPLRIHSKLYRAWQPKIEVDQLGRVHIGYAQAISPDIHGHINYRRIENGQVTASKDEIWYYRADVNWEMDATPDGELHLITGKAAYPAQGGPVTYYNWLHENGSWEGYGDMHDPDAHLANGFVDIFVDANKNVHSCYSTQREGAYNTPAIRYMRIENSSKVRDVVVTEKGEIQAEHLKLGLSSVAASEDGQFVMITYVTGQDGGDLFARLSEDGGQTWGERELIASGLNTLEGRSRQYIKAHGYRFYLVYPSGGIKFRTYQIPGHGGPATQINGPYAGEEGSPIEFTAAGSSDPDGIAMFAWDWENDGIFDDSTASETISHTYLDDYNGEVALRARGIISGMTTKTTTVTVLNAAPVVDLGEDQVTQEGTAIQLIPDIMDPGINDTYTYSWNFGDGTTSSESQPQHAFPDNGSYNVTVIVRDDDGGEGTGSVTVTAENQPPIADAGGPYNARPGEQFTLTGAANDPGTADILTYAWDLDANGTFETTGQTINREYQNDGTYRAILQVTDDDGAAGLDTALIIIGSAAPVVSAVPNQTIDEGDNFTPIELDNYVTDPDNPVDALTWLSEGNVALLVSMTNRVVTVQPPHPDWFGAETIRFIAIDPGTEADSVEVTFTINPINDPPTVTGIPAQTRNEGQDFTPIYLNNFVQDIDNNPAEIFWTASGNSGLNVSITGNVATVAPADSEWAGTESLTFMAHDPSNATGQTTSNFTVIPVNDPPQINNFPDMEFTQYQEISAINLDDTVFDPDNSDSEISWLFFGNVNLNASISTTDRKLHLSPKIEGWYGEETISFIAADPGKLQDMKTVRILIQKIEARPQIATIPEQIVNEGDAFPAINFDDYVSDLNNTANELNWRHYGQQALTVEWDQHQISVLTPNPEWNGSETIWFVVTDPENLKDTTTVVFTALEVNDPPTLSTIPAIVFEEDGVYNMPLSTLREYVSDPDDDIMSLSFGLKNTVNTFWEYQPSFDRIQFSATPNYAGTEIDSIWVKDPSGAMDCQAIQITVTAVQDPISDFDIIYPRLENVFVWLPEKQFIWEKAVDPDPNDYISYQWLLSRSAAFADTFATGFISGDTTYTYHADRRMYKGTYYWKVIAFSTDRSSKESSVGIITTLMTDVDDVSESKLPEEVALLPNHPNPFNPETHVTFELPHSDYVELTVFNSLGQRVRLLYAGEKPAGRHEIVWNATNDSGGPVSTGVYYCRLQCNAHVQLIKLVYTR